MDGNAMHQPHQPSWMFRLRDPISALTHFIALIAAAIGTVPLLLRATNALEAVSLGIFMVSMMLLYAASTAYHSFDLSEAGNKRLKKLDHTMIFFLIAGSYTPVCTVKLGTAGLRLLALVWSLAVVGGLFKLCWVTCPKWVSSVIYIAMGWSCVTAMPQIIGALSRGGFLMLLLGGILYTVGGVLYALKPKSLEGKLFGIHEIFHIFVMLGSLCHYIFMYAFLI